MIYPVPDSTSWLRLETTPHEYVAWLADRAGAATASLRTGIFFEPFPETRQDRILLVGSYGYSDPPSESERWEFDLGTIDSSACPGAATVFEIHVHTDNDNGFDACAWLDKLVVDSINCFGGEAIRQGLLEPTMIQDWSLLSPVVRNGWVKAVWHCLARLLETVNWEFFDFDDETDTAYIELRQLLTKILGADQLAHLRKAFPSELLTASLNLVPVEPGRPQYQMPRQTIDDAIRIFTGELRSWTIANTPSAETEPMAQEMARYEHLVSQLSEQKADAMPYFLHWMRPEEFPYPNTERTDEEMAEMVFGHASPSPTVAPLYLWDNIRFFHEMALDADISSFMDWLCVYLKTFQDSVFRTDVARQFEGLTLNRDDNVLSIGSNLVLLDRSEAEAHPRAEKWYRVATFTVAPLPGERSWLGLSCWRGACFGEFLLGVLDRCVDLFVDTGKQAEAHTEIGETRDHSRLGTQEESSDEKLTREKIAMAGAVSLRLKQLIEASSTGLVYTYSDEADYEYIKQRYILHELVRDVAELGPASEDLEWFPRSLSAIDVDELEYLLPELRLRCGEILAICAENAAEPLDPSLNSSFAEIDSLIAQQAMASKFAEVRLIRRLGLDNSQQTDESELSPQIFEKDTQERPEGRRGGRPSNPDDDWAYAQWKGGREKNAVFEEWRQRPGVVAREPVDPRDTFNKAMRYREKKENKQSSGE